jgi:hypothetical protein
MTYYSDIKFFNGLLVSSLFCYTMLLCLHQCLLHTSCTFYSFAFYDLCTMSLQCTIPLLYISVFALYLLLHASITLNNNPISSLFSILILSVHLVHAICFFLFHPLTPQSPPHRGVFATLLFHKYPISCVPHCLSLFCISCSL